MRIAIFSVIATFLMAAFAPTVYAVTPQELLSDLNRLAKAPFSIGHFGEVERIGENVMPHPEVMANHTLVASYMTALVHTVKGAKDSRYNQYHYLIRHIFKLLSKNIIYSPGLVAAQIMQGSLNELSVIEKDQKVIEDAGAYLREGVRLAFLPDVFVKLANIHDLDKAIVQEYIHRLETLKKPTYYSDFWFEATDPIAAKAYYSHESNELLVAALYTYILGNTQILKTIGSTLVEKFHKRSAFLGEGRAMLALYLADIPFMFNGEKSFDPTKRIYTAGATWFGTPKTISDPAEGFLYEGEAPPQISIPISYQAEKTSRAECTLQFLSLTGQKIKNVLTYPIF